MRKSHETMLYYAKNIAEKSKMRVQHGCVIVDSKGYIISTAFNKYNHFYNIQKPWQKGSRLSCHAEEGALKKVNFNKLEGAKLYVVRISYSGELLNSKPCERCTKIINKFIHKYGLKEVYYSS